MLRGWQNGSGRSLSVTNAVRAGGTGEGVRAAGPECQQKGRLRLVGRALSLSMQSSCGSQFYSQESEFGWCPLGTCGRARPHMDTTTIDRRPPALGGGGATPRFWTPLTVGRRPALGGGSGRGDGGVWMGLWGGRGGRGSWRPKTCGVAPPPPVASRDDLQLMSHPIDRSGRGRRSRAPPPRPPLPLLLLRQPHFRPHKRAQGRVSDQKLGTARRLSAGMHCNTERYPPPPSRAPSLCPATVPLTPSASLNGICNRQ